MSDRPVCLDEIAALFDELRALRSPAHRGDPVDSAAFLTRKADLLTRIVDQHADDWPCGQAAEAGQIAARARAVAAGARAVVEQAGAASDGPARGEPDG